MVHLAMAPSVVRASRVALFLVPALVVASVAGCGHKRQAMRPIYGGSVVTSPATVVPATPGCPTITPGTPTDEPFLTPAPTSVPSTGRADGVIRAGGGSPPVPDSADNYPLTTPPATSTPGGSGSGTGSGSTPGIAPQGSSGPELTPPTTSRSTTGRRTSTQARPPRVSLRDGVRPFVATPDDLFRPTQAERPWKYVVLHHSANAKGGYDQIDRDHRKILGFEGCGYHFVIGNGTDSPDGQVEVAARWRDQKPGVHCRNGKNPEVNESGIGICLVGNFDQAPPTPRQVAAAKALVAYLADEYRIPASRVGTHDQFADGPTACPGQYFPSEAILGSQHLANR